MRERSLAIYEKRLGPEHPSTALALQSLGYTLLLQGDVVAARPGLERALAIREKSHGPTHNDTAVGEQVPGAALITLAAAFSQAGAEAIVASL